ncbi:leucine-rich repeat, cysteine-containing subtype protein [Tanacetum coccineum]
MVMRNRNGYMSWLCVTRLSFRYPSPFDMYDMKDVTHLAKKCSNSLVSLNIFNKSLSDFSEVFKHAKKLAYFGDGIIDEDGDYSGFKFPPNIRGLRILNLAKASFPFLLPYLNQLRELDLCYSNLEFDCQCFLFERCPSLEVLVTQDTCGDEGLQVISQFCKKLRKLTHHGWVTHTGLVALAQGCPNLVYISVNIYDISNEALECVGTHLKNLRDFRFWLGREDDITDSSLDNGVRDMLVGCSKLEKLHIGLCLGGLTDVGLGYIGKYGHNLRSLSLYETGESDVGLFELLKGCPKLRKLRLRRCPFSDQAISTFVFNIHSLRYIWAASDYHPDLLLTRPMVSDKVLTEVYITLAEKLYRLALQLVADGSGAGSVKITYTSSRARETDNFDTPLVCSMVAKDIWKEKWDTLGESSEKPLEIIVRIANVESRFATAVSEVGDIKLQGRVKDGVPHLTNVGAFEVDVSLDGHILLCRQVDEPNTISRVTSILGEENVNISSMSVDRAAPIKQAIMVIVVDQKPSKEALKKIDEIPAVEEFVFLALIWAKCDELGKFRVYISALIPTARGDKTSRVDD